MIIKNKYKKVGSKNFIKTHIFPWRVALLSPIKRSKCQLSNSFFTHTWVYYVQQQHRVDRLSWAAALVIYYATQKPRLISNEMVLVVSIPNQTVLYISPSNSVGERERHANYFDIRFSYTPKKQFQQLSQVWPAKIL